MVFLYTHHVNICNCLLFSCNLLSPVDQTNLNIFVNVIISMEALELKS